MSKKEIDSYILEQINKKEIPYIDVVVHKDNMEIYRFYCGDGREKITGKEKLLIYSATKPLTVVLTMKLIEENKMSLDDEVAKWLEDYNELYILDENKNIVKTSNKMTIRHLLTMTGGLTYDYKKYPIEETIQSNDSKEDTQTIVKAEITSAPSTDSVSVNDIYLAISSINYDAHSTGWNGTGFYKVTSVTTYTVDKTFNSNPVTYNDISDVNVNGIIHYTGNYWNDGWAGEGYYRLVSKDSSSQTYSVTKLTDPNYVVEKQNQPVTDETDNMKAKLSSFNTNDYYDVMQGTDLSNLTINTDHKHEILMGD